jgi:hypothetical protein
MSALVRDIWGRSKPAALDDLPRIFREDPEMQCAEDVMIALGKLQAIKGVGARNRVRDYIDRRLEDEDAERAYAAPVINE